MPVPRRRLIARERWWSHCVASPRQRPGCAAETADWASCRARACARAVLSARRLYGRYAYAQAEKLRRSFPCPSVEAWRARFCDESECTCIVGCVCISLVGLIRWCSNTNLSVYVLVLRCYALWCDKTGAATWLCLFTNLYETRNAMLLVLYCFYAVTSTCTVV